MSKQHVEFYEDSFVDFVGNERKFTLCAVSRMNDNDLICMASDDGFYVLGHSKSLSVGYAICSASDTYKADLGRIIAQGRAEKAKPIMWVSDPGAINSKMVRAFLEQEADYFKMNPEHYIAGYQRAADKYGK